MTVVDFQGVAVGGTITRHLDPSLLIGRTGEIIGQLQAGEQRWPRSPSLMPFGPLTDRLVPDKVDREEHG